MSIYPRRYPHYDKHHDVIRSLGRTHSYDGRFERVGMNKPRLTGVHYSMSVGICGRTRQVTGPLRGHIWSR